MRHYVRLSRNNYSIDAGLYPLGSCTMKHNPRLNEKMARLPGFADLHPLQPISTVQGALELIDALARALLTMTGMQRGGDVAEGRRARRTVRHDGDQGGDRGARRRQDAQRRAGARIARTAPIPRPAALIGFSVRAVPAGADGVVERRGGARGARPRRRRDHADQPQHLRPVRARDRRDRRGGARGGRLFLLRRRQFQRDRRQDAARRPRRRRDAHQPAQDLLDAARRRRARRRARSSSPNGSPPFAPVPYVVATATRCDSSNTPTEPRRSAA